MFGAPAATSKRRDQKRLKALNLVEKIKLVTLVPEDFSEVSTIIDRIKPDEIYHLAGQSSVGMSFERPAETMQSFTLSTLNVLEAVRISNQGQRLYFAGSSECFGDTRGQAASELTAFAPLSPYAVAKVAAYWLVCNYRQAYGIWAVNRDLVQP